MRLAVWRTPSSVAPTLGRCRRRPVGRSVSPAFAQRRRLSLLARGTQASDANVHAPTSPHSTPDPLIRLSSTPLECLRYAERVLFAEVPEPRLSAEHLLTAAVNQVMTPALADAARAATEALPRNSRPGWLMAWQSVLLLPLPVQRSALLAALQTHRIAQKDVATAVSAGGADRTIAQVIARVQAEFSQLCARRQRREPVQYLCGDWEFHRLTLKMRAPVLIPRPETEELVAHALQCLATHNRPATPLGRPLRVLDVGCGSGAIILSLLAALRGTVVQAVAIDPSAEAVQLTVENAALNDIAASERSDVAADAEVLQALRMSITEFAAHLHQQRARCGADASRAPPTFDLVISNPPYIPPRDMPALAPEILQYESAAALSGIDPDGMRVIRDILRACAGASDTASATALLAADGELWMEVDPSQPPLIQEELQSSSGGLPNLEWVETRTDWSGAPRFVRLRRRGTPAHRPRSDA
ncbi:hypothetical protein CDCA_CDCA09G2766 [Cyanidium caldarium]|uniref:S-adenosyl-L-methionine-dependent methyltransferase n=1 Tax=Cyanidium caldarium TaxID=2771 RepID=A0AAV9IXD1_CYACA|nr:hypothetical protein CDCA_CDCA09G2766 [Cyanidium caldarium]